MKHPLKLFSPVFLFLLIAFAACQKDDTLYNTEGNSNGNSRIISLEELKQMPKAYSRLMEVVQSQQRKSNDTVWKFDVNTDEILHYKNGTDESFTFSATPEVSRTYVENLVLNLEANNEYSVYYAIYNFTDDIKRSWMII